MKMIINGQKVDSSDGKTQNVVNPATLQVIVTVPSRHGGGHHEGG